MRSRLLAALVVGALTVPLLGTTGASAEPREVTGPSLPDQASGTAADRATDALAAAQALFAEKSPAAARRQAATRPDATMVLNQLMRARDDLSAADRKRADAMLARPTADGGDGTLDYGDAPHASYCGDIVCIHYVTDVGDPNAPDLTDAGGAPVPDTVESALATAESVHDTYDAAGYRRPDGDGALGGGTNLVDVYMGDLGGLGLYGYCTSDQGGSTFNRWAYCAIDEAFEPAQFGTRNTPLENQRVTLAHEYYHAVQFAYDAFEDGWIMEATATWAEEQLFDGIDDNRQYLAASQIRLPFIPLDAWVPGESFQYGNWIFFEYLTRRWRAETGTMPTLVLELWQRMSGRAGALDQFSTQAIQAELSQRNTSFTSVYGQFADANRRPQKTYPEGNARAYRPARPAATRTLSATRRSTPNFFADLDHLTSLTLRLKPARGLTKRDWKVRVRVDMPPAKTAPVARVAVYLKSGKVRSSTVRFKKRGFSSKVVGFSSRSVKYVELVVVNASRRSQCWIGDPTFACQGQPLDDPQRFKFNASIFRS